MYLQGDVDKNHMKKLIEEIKKSKNGKSIGVFGKENYPGAFADMWRSMLKKESFETVSPTSLKFHPLTYLLLHIVLKLLISSNFTFRLM